MDDDLIEAYIATRSGKKYGGNKSEPYVNKMKNKKVIINDDNPMDIDEEKIRIKKMKDKSKFDTVKSYDIVEDLMSQRANVMYVQIL